MKEPTGKLYNAQPQYNSIRKRWQPRMNTNQDGAIRLIARAHPNCPFYKIDGRTLRSLRQRGWVQPSLPLLTDLGLEVVKKFWPEQLERSE